MLTGKAKIGYLLAYNGLLVFLYSVIGFIAGDANSLSSALMAIGVGMFVGGCALLWRGSATRSLLWKLLWTHVVLTDRDKAAQFLIFFGSFMLSMQLCIISWNSSASFWSWYIGIPLVALVIGWVLAFSEFWQSRSPQK